MYNKRLEIPLANNISTDEPREYSIYQVIKKKKMYVMNSAPPSLSGVSLL